MGSVAQEEQVPSEPAAELETAVPAEWYEVLAETIQSFSEVVAVLIGAGLTIWLSRREHERQRTAARDERRLDAGTSVIESMDRLIDAVELTKQSATSVVDTDGLAAGALKVARIEALVPQLAQTVPEMLSATKDLRTSLLRYELVASKKVAASSTLLESAAAFAASAKSASESTGDDAISHSAAVSDLFESVRAGLDSLESEVWDDLAE